MGSEKHRSRGEVEKELAEQKVKVDRLEEELAKRDQTVARLEESSGKIKAASMDAVKDYKERFAQHQERAQEAIGQLDAAREQHKRELQGWEKKYAELNARHGEKIRQLQEDLKQEKECNAQTLAIASGSKGWGLIEPASVAVKWVKDLRTSHEQLEEEAKDLREFHTRMLAAEESTEEPVAEEPRPKPIVGARKKVQGEG